MTRHVRLEPMSLRDILKTRPIPGKALERTLNRLLISSEVREGLTRLAEDGDLLRRLSPELGVMVGFGGRGHKELWPHVLRVVQQTPPVLHLRWAALFHDVGKPDTFERGSKVTFHGHEQLSAQMFNQFCRRYNILRDIRDRVRFLILHLGWIENYSPEWTDSAVRRFSRNAGEHVDDLITLGQADLTTKNEARKLKLRSRLEELRKRVRDLRALDAVEPPLPKGIGLVISERVGIPPSKQLGDVRARLEGLVEEGHLERNLDANVYVNFILENRGLFELPEILPGPAESGNRTT